ncbi:MAG TPA: DUF302 domain-containing protein [Stellaceae bacterium]|nr:DUF302 domain-containing protein [Stellaceae bacterium]
MPNKLLALAFAAFCTIWLGMSDATAADAKLITKPSAHSVKETIERFERAVMDKGWVVFTEIDHAAAAAKVGLELKPRTVVIFGNPKLGTAPMQGTPTLAIDLPLKALVWQDETGKVWLSYNSADYLADVYARHGRELPADARSGIGDLLNQLSDQAVK